MTLKVERNSDKLLTRPPNRFMTLNESLNFTEAWPPRHEMSTALSYSPGWNRDSAGTGLYTRDARRTKQLGSALSCEEGGHKPYTMNLLMVYQKPPGENLAEGREGVPGTGRLLFCTGGQGGLPVPCHLGRARGGDE